MAQEQEALNNLPKILQDLEYSLARDWGLNKISGGFVYLKFNSIDVNSNLIYLTCKSGVQNDVENDVIEEEMLMDLQTFKII